MRTFCYAMLEHVLNDHPLGVLSDELWVSINYEAVLNPQVDEWHRNFIVHVCLPNPLC